MVSQEVVWRRTFYPLTSVVVKWTGGPRHLRWAHELGAFPDALLDVASLLVGDGGMLGRALVGHQYPEHVPEDANAPCVCGGQSCVLFTDTPERRGRKSMGAPA